MSLSTDRRNPTVVDLYQHQRDGSRWIVEHKRSMLHWECGVGKTFTVLAGDGELRAAGEVKKALVICPRALIDAAWKEDASKWNYKLKVTGWHDWGNKLVDARLKRWLPGDICVINFESFLHHHKQIDPSLFDLLVVDESSRMKDPNSKTAKAVRAFAARVPRVVLLSGTPAPNDALEWWGQIACIDPKIFGPYPLFRREYGMCKKLRFGGPTFERWQADPAKVPAMLGTLGPVVHTLRKQDCLDLPDQVDVVLGVDLSAEEQQSYTTFENDLVLQMHDGVIDAHNVLTETMKLRQLTSGWVYDANKKAHDTGESKQKALTEALEMIGPPGTPAIIWIEFREDARRIAEQLGDEARLLIGGMTVTEQHDSIMAFKDGYVPYLIANPATAGHGLTFTNCNYAIFYSWNYSFETHKQARDRIHRIGQNNKCTYLYLVARNTIDEDVLQVVQGKVAAHEAATKYLRSRTLAAEVEGRFGDTPLYRELQEQGFDTDGAGEANSQSHDEVAGQDPGQSVGSVSGHGDEQGLAGYLGMHSGSTVLHRSEGPREAAHPFAAAGA